MLIVICIMYTLLSLTNAAIYATTGQGNLTAANSFTMVMWISIGVGIIYTHELFPNLSPLVMAIIQYIVAMSIVFASIYIGSWFTTVHPDGYRDAFRSFTIPYIIGAGVYYYHVFRAAKKQNALLQEIKEGQKD